MLYLNEAFERIWNIKRETIGSNLKLLLETVHPDDRAHVTNCFVSLREDKQRQSAEFRVLQSDGTIKWVKVQAYLSDKGDKKIVLGTATEITDYKTYIETLHKFSDKKNSILEILSHDLLGPLGNIQMSSMLLSEHPEINENSSIMQLINMVNANTKRSVAMIQDLINHEFLESSETKLVKQRLDIIVKLRELIDEYRKSSSIIKQNIRLITAADSLYISIDITKFSQVLNNLISNVLKFTPDDGNITITVEEQGEIVRFTVTDDGIGNPADLQPFLFDKFTKARRPGIKGEPATGLGMSIILRIVEWHKGRIWFESEDGKGTTFYVEIPKDDALN